MRSTNNWEFIDRNSLIVSLAEPERALTPGSDEVGSGLGNTSWVRVEFGLQF